MAGAPMRKGPNPIQKQLQWKVDPHQAQPPTKQRASAKKHFLANPLSPPADFFEEDPRHTNVPKSSPNHNYKATARGGRPKETRHHHSHKDENTVTRT
ncbi:hypothetical protein Ancab_021318 [Ancistrocladus abbreviatus]